MFDHVSKEKLQKSHELSESFYVNVLILWYVVKLTVYLAMKLQLYV